MSAEKAEQQASRYLIFRRVSEDTWKQLGEVDAINAYGAREQAIEQFGLVEDVRNGSLEMVSLGARFWLPKRPKMNVSESLDVS